MSNTLYDTVMDTAQPGLCHAHCLSAQRIVKKALRAPLNEAQGTTPNTDVLEPEKKQ